jgi:hypothetical protein
MATLTFPVPAFVLRGPGSGKSILGRWYDFVSTSRRCRADQMTASYASQMGGKFTDRIESNIESSVIGTSRTFGAHR